MPGPKYGEFEFSAEQGFTGSAGVQHVKGYQRGGSVKKAAGGKVGAEAKVGKVMGEFKAGSLRSGSKAGPKVTRPKQAVAIALNEAGLSKPNYSARAKQPGGMKRGGGVPVHSAKPLVGE